jgi:hypothetical protein
MDNAEWIIENETPITFVCSLLHSPLSIVHSAFFPVGLRTAVLRTPVPKQVRRET